MKILKILPAVFLTALLAYQGQAREKSPAQERAWVGTWQYSAPQAEYPYEKGKIVFSMEGKELKAFVETNGHKASAWQLKVADNKASFTITIEGEPVKVLLQIKGSELTGSASYSGGKVSLQARKATS